MARRLPHLSLLNAARVYAERTRQSPLEAACWYAERGIPVVPCHYPVGRSSAALDGAACSCGQLTCPHPGAHPLPSRGLETATTNLDELRSWWERYPQANVGLVTGVAFDVLDVDKLVGALAIGRLQQAGVALGPVSRTAAGRWHFYVAPTGLPSAVLPGAFGGAPGTRHRVWWHAAGGYVLAPPSRAPGGTARWLRELETTPLPEAPTLLSVLLAPPTPVQQECSNGG